MPAEKDLFLVCRKTGRIVGLNRKCRWCKLFFPFVGLLALVWYLVRVIPKPSRASYPCQRVGAPIAFGGIAYFLSLFGLVTAFRKARKFIYQHRFAAAGVCLLIGLVCSVVVRDMNETSALAADTGTFTPSDDPNQPIGTARGINPGRVAWSYDLTACNWNGSSNYWFSEAFNDQAKITKIMNNVICSVAGQSSVSNAWDVLFRDKNGGASAPSYVKGEKITVKLNLNNGGGYRNQIDASPQSVYALLDGLVSQFGADQKDIVLCDPARENKCSVISNYCHTAFPDVNYDSNLGGFTPNAFAYSAAGPTETSMSTAIVKTKYLITMAILKRHCTPAMTYQDGTDKTDYGNASVTMIFKSNWGIIGNKRASQHALLHDWDYPMASYNQLVDMYGSTNINGKTVLNILDGLYTGDRWNSPPHKWAMAPFNGHWPSSFFASQDPVAIESVGLDFLRSEMPLIKNADRHLHEAALANDPPSGTVYKPDGVRLQSLGVHEHWNNATDKKYSRNLDPAHGKGIELICLAVCDATNKPVVAANTAKPAGNMPLSPAVLPGKGLAQHPFLYAGEWDTRKPDQSMFLVRDGKVVWQYSIPLHLPDKRIQEFDDATLLSDGNIIFSRMSGAGMVSPDKKLVWDYPAPPGTEVHSIQSIGKDRVLIMRNGNPAQAMIFNTANNTVEKEIPIPTTIKGTHGQFRHIRMTPAGTILVGHMSEGKVVEYDQTGKEVWSVKAEHPWQALRLKNGNTLITGDSAKYVREVNPKGETVWELNQSDVPDIKLGNIQAANRLANGNTVICNWIAGDNNHAHWPGTVQIFEVNPAREVVWALSEWKDPDLGPSTSIQLLDEPGTPEGMDQQR